MAALDHTIGPPLSNVDVSAAEIDGLPEYISTEAAPFAWIDNPAISARDNRAIYLMKTTTTRDALTEFEGMRAFTEDGNAWVYTGGDWEAATAYTVSQASIFMGDLTVGESLTFRTAHNLLGIPYIPGTEV